MKIPKTCDFVTQPMSIGKLTVIHPLVDGINSPNIDEISVHANFAFHYTTVQDCT